ncbi:MAG: hypothetical protein QM726_22725 [Chitinophagaceae bacterium]
MKKSLPIHEADRLKKGYNEKNPGQPQGAFPPDAASQRPKTKDLKSNTADKKSKEDNN